MTPIEALAQHRQICDVLYDIALEENRFLQQQQRPPEQTLIERKRTALEKLDETMAALRAVPSGSVREPELRAALDKIRSRIMQILQLDKENEQLLLRYSLSRGTPVPGPSVAPGMLQKIYSRHS